MLNKIFKLFLVGLLAFSPLEIKKVNAAVTGNIAQYSSEMQSYIATLGETPTDAYRVDQFFRALVSAGLYDDLVDGAFLRTTQNLSSGTNLKTIFGQDATITGSPDIGPNGVFTNGTTQYIYWPVTDTTTNTVAMTAKGVVSGQTSGAAYWSLQNVLGIGTSATMGGMSLLFNGTGNGYVFTIQTASAATTNTLIDPISSSAHYLNYYNPYEQFIIVTNDNASSPALTGYIDGKSVMTDSSGNRQTTVARNRFVIGARIYEAGVGGVQNFFRGTFTNWFLFNKVLSATEAKALSDAMRWLNPAKKNIVYIGDSTSTWFYTKPVDSWTYQHSCLKDQQDKKPYVVAVNGQNTTFFNTNYDDFIKRYRPGINGVEESYAFVWLGINDINGGSTDAQTYTALKSLWSKLKRDGFRVYVMTLMPGTSYTVTTDGYRTALNTSILGDPALYDSVYRADLFFSDPNDTTLYLDGYHLLTEANRQLANAVNMDTSEILLRPRTYPLTDASTIATDCSKVPDGAVMWVTLAGNRTLGNPTNCTNGRKLTYRLKQDATGSRTITLDTKFAAGPYTVTLTTTANKADYLEVVYNLAADKFEVVTFTKGY